MGTAIGAVLLGTIDNGLNLLDVSPFLQDVVKGLVILFAVYLDRNSATFSRLAALIPRTRTSGTVPSTTN